MLDRLVAEMVAELLNAMLDAEADEIANAAIRAHRGAEGVQGRLLDRSLTAKAARLPRLKVPKLAGAVFESARSSNDTGDARRGRGGLIDMRGTAGVSTRQVDDISQLLWGDRMPSQTLSDKRSRRVRGDRGVAARPLEDEYPYVPVWTACALGRRGAGTGERQRPVATGVNAEGHCEVIAWLPRA